MKEKALMVILPLCVAMAMTACGGNADPTEVEKTTAIAESTEADTQDAQAEAEAEAPTVGEEAVEPEQAENEAPAEEKEFPYVSDYALKQDKSADYGVYSTSCFDIDQFISEDGMRPTEWDLESKESSEYSGRFAYPEITECRFTTDASIESRSDCEESIVTIDSETGVVVRILFSVGRDAFEAYKSYIGLGIDPKYGVTEIMGTIQTNEGESELVHYYQETGYISGGYDDDGEGGEEPLVTMHNYFYMLGNFTVDIIWVEKEGLTQEDIQLIADNIQLVGEVAK